jgi:hypothetical protein
MYKGERILFTWFFMYYSLLLLESLAGTLGWKFTIYVLIVENT